MKVKINCTIKVALEIEALPKEMTLGKLRDLPLKLISPISDNIDEIVGEEGIVQTLDVAIVEREIETKLGGYEYRSDVFVS